MLNCATPYTLSGEPSAVTRSLSYSSNFGLSASEICSNLRLLMIVRTLPVSMSQCTVTSSIFPSTKSPFSSAFGFSLASPRLSGVAVLRLNMAVLVTGFELEGSWSEQDFSPVSALETLVLKGAFHSQ